MDVNDKEIENKRNIIPADQSKQCGNNDDIDSKNGENEDEGTQKTDADDLKANYRTFCKNILKTEALDTNKEDKETENVKNIRETDGVDAGKDDVTEKISEKEAESRFLLWYNNILEREEWHKRRIKELESSEERYTQKIALLQDNDRKLQQRYAEALIEIKVLRRKNILTEDDEQFLESYKSLLHERDKLLNVARESNFIIKSLRKDVLLLRARNSLEFAHRLKMRKMKLPSTTEHLKKQTQITENGETGNCPRKKLTKAGNLKRNIILSDTNVTETDKSSLVISTNRKVHGKDNKVQREKVDESVKKEKVENEKTSSVFLPDIRLKPGDIKWKW